MISFLFTAWKSCCAGDVGSTKLFVCHENLCHLIHVVKGVVVVEEVPDLFCDHEEADTRLLLHAKHASSVYSNILIQSPDTDVMLLCIAFAGELSNNLYFCTGTGNNTRIVDITSISNVYGVSLCKALLGLHVFTGCDSVSAFKGKGKVKGLKIMLESAEFCSVFEELGMFWTLPSASCKILEQFVCVLYGQKDCTEVNEARYLNFRLKCLNDAGLPPNKDCLKHHAMRANYQCGIYRRSLLPMISAPSPDGNGWTVENDDIIISWMSDPPAPESVLKNVHCSCKKNRCLSRVCSCKSASLPCTDLCGCNDCENNATKNQEESDSDSDADD